jgi:hypothetical protein
VHSTAMKAISAAKGSADRPGNAPRLLVHVPVGSPVDEIVALARQIGADLIVLGTHGRRGLRRLWLGSVAEHVVRSATCPVLVVRPTRPPAPSKAFRPEPACEDCLARREATDGRLLWCERHEHPPEDAHRYTYNSVFDYTAEPYNKVW